MENTFTSVRQHRNDSEKHGVYSLAKLTEREKFTASMGTYYIIYYTVVSVSSGNKMFRFSWMGGRHSDARGNTYQEIDLARNTGANFGRLCHDRDYLPVPEDFHT